MRNYFLLKILLTFLLIAILIIKIDISAIIQILYSLNYFFLIPTFFLVPLLYTVRTVRWIIILRSKGFKISFIRGFNLMMIGSFYGLITPGKIGEFGRVYHMDIKKTLSLPTIVLEKIIDIEILISLSALTFFLFFMENYYLGIIMIIFFIGGIFMVICLLYFPYIKRLGKFIKVDEKTFYEYRLNIIEIIRDRNLMLLVLTITLLYYGIAYLIGLFITLSAGFSPLMVISLPIIVLMGNVPLTISGIGIRESVGSIIFVALGESAADGFVYSLLLFILITVIPGIWGYFLILRGVK